EHDACAHAPQQGGRAPWTHISPLASRSYSRFLSLLPPQGIARQVGHNREVLHEAHATTLCCSTCSLGSASSRPGPRRARPGNLSEPCPHHRGAAEWPCR